MAEELTDRRAPFWTCFHCGETFTNKVAARDHFGLDQGETPACVISAQDGGLVRALRDAHGLLRRYQEEDTDLHRQIGGMHVDHRQALQREEEKGYERGLRDGRAIRDE